MGHDRIRHSEVGPRLFQGKELDTSPRRFKGVALSTNCSAGMTGTACTLANAAEVGLGSGRVLATVWTPMPSSTGTDGSGATAVGAVVAYASFAWGSRTLVGIQG